MASEELNENDFGFDIDFDENIEIVVEIFIDEDSDLQQKCVIEEDSLQDCEVEELTNIPKLVFVDEDDISTVTVIEPIKKSNKTSSTIPSVMLKCVKCDKGYKTQGGLTRHKALCKREKPAKKKEKQTSTKKKKSKKSSKEMFVLEGIDVKNYLQQSIEMAMKDPFFNMCEPGISVGKIAKELHDNLKLAPTDNQPVKSYEKHICEIFTNILTNKNSKHSEKEKIFRDFYNVSIDKGNFEKFKEFCKEFKVDCKETFLQMLYQFVLDKLLQLILKHQSDKKSRIEGTIENLDALALDNEEEQTLRYTSGFIVFSLKNSIKNKRSPEGAAALAVLSKWGSKEDDTKSPCSLLEYTNHWVDIVNRGGLMYVSDDFYLFIRRVEVLARKILNLNFLTTYCGEDLKVILQQEFKNSSLLRSTWDSLTNEIANKQLTNKMYERILKKWINMRCYYFVNTWLQILKRKATINNKKKFAEKGATSLRKSLASNNPLESGQPSMRKSVNKKKD